IIRKGDLLSLKHNEIVLDIALFQQKAKLEDEVALELYQPLLDGFNFKSRNFDEWLANHRLSLHTEYTKLSFKLAKNSFDNKHFLKALEFSNIIIEQNPLHEEACLLNIEVLCKLGHRHEAIKKYKTLKKHLYAELNLKPLPETQAKVTDLLNQLEHKPTLKTSPKRIKNIFVGRENDLKILQKNITDYPINHIYGDSGIGKTRLLKEFSSLQNMKVVFSECVRGGQFPYGLWAENLNIKLHSAENSFQVAEQIAQALERLIGQSNQLIWIIDDAQWATSESLAILPYLIRRLKNYKLSFILSSHGEAALESQLTGFAVKLSQQPLLAIPDEDLLELLLINQVPKQKSQLLLNQAEGNPFILNEILLAYVQGSNTTLPDSIRKSVLLRYQQLSDIAQRTADIAAIVGREVSSQLLQRLLNYSDDRFSQACEELEANYFFVASKQGFKFVHQKLPEAILTKLSKSRERLLNKQIAKALIKASFAKNAEQILIHAQKALMWPEFYRAATQAAADSRRLGARGKAAYFESKALEVQALLNKDQSFEILLRREDDYHTLGHRKKQLLDIETLEQLSNNNIEIAQSFFRRGRYLRAIGKFQKAESSLREALMLSQSDFQIRLELAYTLSNRGLNSEAEQLAKSVFYDAIVNKNIDFQLLARFCLAFILNKQTKYLEAEAVLLEVEALARYSLKYRAKFWLLLADTTHRKEDADKLIGYTTKAFKAFKQLNDFKGQADALDLRSIAACQKPDIKLARESLSAAEEIFIILDDKIQIAGCQLNWGYLNEKSLKNPRAAIPFYQKGLEYFSELNFTRGMAYSYFNLSSCYNNIFEPKKAEKLARLAIEHSEEIPSSKAYAYMCLGNAQRLQKKYQDSLKNYARAEALQNQFNFPDSNIRLNYAISYLALENYKKVNESLEEVENTLSRESALKNHLLQLVKAYYYHLQNQFENRKKYLKLAKTSFINEIKTLKKKEKER
ncbi:MAG TPA: hypothetical protein ENK21_09415, partial [Trueperaceae bacterium]|nr:hypothetical protein [Trueperaceae bacterium]